jgi:hypothetical protein
MNITLKLYQAPDLAFSADLRENHHRTPADSVTGTSTLQYAGETPMNRNTIA